MPKRRRRRGEGSVYFDHAAGSWMARVSLGTRDGKRVGKKVRAPSERAARGELERLRRAYLSGADPSTGTLDEYLAAWLERHRDPRDSTLRSYADHIRLHISPLLGGIPLARLRPADVDRLIADRLRAKGRGGRPLSPSTVRRIVTTLRIALNAAVKRGDVTVNVALQVSLPRVERRYVAAMSDVDADRIVEAVVDHWIYPLVRLLNGSALRLGEALSLNQGDVDLEGRFVRIRESKTTIRAVPVSDDALDALRLAIARAPRRGPNEPIYFGPRSGERLTVSSASHALPRLLVGAGLPRRTPHGLRHGAASRMVAGGVHMRVVAEQLGHKDPALTARTYAHVLPEHQRDAIRVLDRPRKTGSDER